MAVEGLGGWGGGETLYNTECYTPRCPFVSRVTCMYPCLLIKVLSKYALQLKACSKKRLLRCLCSCTHTLRLHLSMVAELSETEVPQCCRYRRYAPHRWRQPVYPVCFILVKVTGVSPVYLTLVKTNGGDIPETRFQDKAMASHSDAPCEHGEGDDDYVFQNHEQLCLIMRQIKDICKSCTDLQHFSR